jgi:UDP-glucose 4-epimerase
VRKDNEKRNVLILGGNGFIGKNLIPRFVKSYNLVIVFDRSFPESNSMEKTKFIQGDFNDKVLLKSIFDQFQIDYVVHLISTTLPHNSNDRIKFDIESNLINTIYLLDLCVEYEIRNILYISSGGTVYGKPLKFPVKESHPTHPINSYGIIKLTIEKYIQLYNHLYGLNFTILRAANPYGPHQLPNKGQGVISSFIQKIYNNQPIEIWGDKNISRDYIYIDDLTELILLASYESINDIFNAGFGMPVTLDDILFTLKELDLEPDSIVYHQSRKADIPLIYLDIEKVSNRFNWKPRVKLNEGIEKYISWFKNEYPPNGKR